METGLVNQELSETDLIDSLFNTCDVHRTGRVLVSALIAYMEKVTDTNEQNREAVQKLALCLDPEGQNCEVDLDTYRHGMRTWIDQLRSQLSDQCSAVSAVCFVEETPLPSMCGDASVLYFQGSCVSQKDSHSVDNTALQMESDGGDHCNKVKELQHSIRRLLEEKSKLRNQVDMQDDSLAALAHEKRALLNKIRGLQEIADLQSEVDSENGELRSLLSHQQEVNKLLENRTGQLERKSTSLLSQLQDTEQKFYTLSSEGDADKNIIKELRRTLSQKKIALEKAEAEQKILKIELSDTKQVLTELKTSLEELSIINKGLERTNAELQLHLSQTQQQLAIQRRQPRISTSGLVQFVDGSETEEENSDDSDNIGRSLLQYYTADELSSIPMETVSIHSEIKDMLEEGGNLGCPLSGKEQTETLSTEDELLAAAEFWDLDIINLLSQMANITLESFVAVLTKGCRRSSLCDSGRRRLTSSTEAAEKGSLQEKTDILVGEKASVNTAKTEGTFSRQGSVNLNERLKGFLKRVKELKEENERLQIVHKSAVDSVLNWKAETMSQITSADTRVMLLRDVLQEERVQKTKFQEQVMNLKKILGIVDKKDSLEFETVKDTLCRQQYKIEHLKRSNLELAEKYHIAELKITDLEEEAQEVLRRLDKEKQQCSNLEAAVSSTAVARQLDLQDILRLVQTDADTECVTEQDDPGISISTEEIKDRISQEIQARDSKLKRLELLAANLKSGSKPRSLPPERNFGGHCCGYRCTFPSTPLVDALTINFMDGNYPMLSNMSGLPTPSPRGRCSVHHDAYMNYMRLSVCEDVDCMYCRAYRLGHSFQGGVTSSCPSLQLRLGQDLPIDKGYRDLHSTLATALDYNFNSQPGYRPQLHRDCDLVSRGGVVSSSLPTSVMTSTKTDPASRTSSDKTSQNNVTSVANTAPLVDTVLSSSHAAHNSAVHRRLDLDKAGMSTTTDNCSSHTTNVESNSCSSEFRSRLFSLYNNSPSEQTETSSKQDSPAGFRRMSFLTAVDESKKSEVDWNRRPSYRAAIDPSYLAAGDWTESEHLQVPENWQGEGLGGYGDGRAENKTMTFQPRGEENSHGAGDGRSGGGGSGGDQPYLSSYNFPSSTDSDSAFWGSSKGASTSRGSSGAGGQPRKLSILVEEENADDLQRTPEKCRSLSSYCSCTPTSTPQHFEFTANDEHEADPMPVDARVDFADKQRSGDYRTLHGSSFGGSPKAATSPTSSDDVKAYLLASAEQSPDMARRLPCNAENMPAHFKQRSELPSSVSTYPATSASDGASDGASACASDEASSKTCDTTTTTSTSSPSTSCLDTTVASSQSLVIVPGSPPQTPRCAHDGHLLPAAVPSRLAKLRQDNLAKKREQMKTMKMPELSEHAESPDTELLPGTSNGMSSPSSPTTKSPLKSSSSLSAENDDSCRTDDSGDGSDREIQPPSPSDDAVTPSIPDSFLKQLRLSTNSESDLNNGEQSIDQLSDKQLESRFNSLALAFRTDRLTLDKRLGIQERARDIAEQNIDKELQGLRDAVDKLNQLYADEKVQEVIKKIQNHLNVLEHSVARVSSRAEVFGAVQQEKRMCLAMEVMITFTENIRRLRSTEQSEVEEARKVLNSSRQFSTNFSLDTLSIGDRRSASVCAAFQNPRTARRRSEVALPRFFGGAGSPLHVTSSMEPRQRFQSATANVTVRNVVTSTLRQASMERQKALPSMSVASSNTLSADRTSPADKSQEKATNQNAQEEEAYRHGYEEGLKASLSRELTELRDQQTTISSSLEQVMDRVEAFQQDEKDESDIQEAVSKLKALAARFKLWIKNPPNWQSASHTLRKVAATLIFLAALGIVLVTFTPAIPVHLSRRSHSKSTQ